MLGAILVVGLGFIGFAAEPAAPPTTAADQARELIRSFDQGQDGFGLARKLVALGPKVLPAVQDSIAKKINPLALPYLRQAEGWLLWEQAPPDQRNLELARKVLQGILRAADGSVRYLKVNFDAYCKVGAVGMPPALEQVRSYARNLDSDNFPANLTYLVQMLAECADAGLAAELGKMLAAESAWEREAAAFTLRGIAQRGGKIRVATPGLLRALTDAEERTIKNAAQALYFQRDPSILKDVFPLLSDDRALVRAIAAELVEGLTGRDPGFKAEAPTPERERVIAQIRKLLTERGILPAAEEGSAAQSQPQTQTQPAAAPPPIQFSSTN